ncbi:hypothetical protein [uncultured Christiangramia sp.]|uniref:hypothetical protein n=1 Tax=Christiangramia sp. 3-2217-3z TaxID=3417564 RepID=UPI002627BC94|nr:hypothetical protein [uncultured Christiangramia sp.]
MKKLLRNIIPIFLIAFNSYSQSITSGRTKVFEQYNTEFGKPKEIKNKNTFYNKSGKEIKEEKITFSKNLDTITELRYKNSQLDARLVFIFDEDKNLIFRSFKNKVPLFGWQSQKAEYKYNRKGIQEINDLDPNNNILRKAIFENDSIGNPISMKLYDRNNNLLGYETAEYKYSNNSYTYKVYDSKENLKTSSQHTIDNKQSKSNNYNEHGDVISYPRNWNENDNIYYLLEYKYDDMGNWVEKKIYKVEKQGDTFVNKEKDRRFKRKIEYWEE